MSARPFRFLQSSDFHLELPPGGLVEIPESLRSLLLDAPYRAAANVFDAALREQVDFVLLCGDLVDPHRAGPRGTAFLRDQFERLRERGIDVYWALGAAEAACDIRPLERWPSNLHLFPSTHVERYHRPLSGAAGVEICGHSWNPSPDIPHPPLIPSASGAYRIFAAYADVPDPRHFAGEIHYWALGGEHEPTLPGTHSPVIHHAGAPQGRNFDETGVRGCTLVEVDASGTASLRPLASDVVRYERLTLTLPESFDSADIAAELHAGALRACENNPRIPLMISWRLAAAWRHSRADLLARCEHWLSGLRAEFGGWAQVHIAGLEIDPPPVAPPLLLEAENVAADYARALADLRRRGQAPSRVDSYWQSFDQPLVDILSFNRAAARDRALAEAAWLGVELLVPEETRS